LHDSLTQTPATFGPKSSLMLNYSSNPSCVSSLKFLASMVAEINIKCTVNNTRSLLSSRDFRLCAASATALGLLAAGLPF